MLKIIPYLYKMKKGEFIIDTDGSCRLVTNITKTSIELYHLRDSSNGIDCTQWYSLDNNFIKRFKYTGLKGLLEFFNTSSTDTITRYYKQKEVLTKRFK